MLINYTHDATEVKSADSSTKFPRSAQTIEAKQTQKSLTSTGVQLQKCRGRRRRRGWVLEASWLGNHPLESPATSKVALN